MRIDRTQPAIGASGDAESCPQSDAAGISISTGSSGAAKAEVSKDGGEAGGVTGGHADGYAVTEDGECAFAVTNGAGATANATVSYDRLDGIKPVVAAGTHGYASGEQTGGGAIVSVANAAGNLGATAPESRPSAAGGSPSRGAAASDDEGGTTCAFRAISESGAEGEETSVAVRIDRAAPDGGVEINGSSVKTPAGEVPLGLFLDGDAVVAVSAEDSLSGVGSAERRLGAEILTEEQVAEIADRAACGSEIGVAARDAEAFACYVRVADSAGNITCFASVGAVFDLAPPAVSGVADGVVHCAAQKMTVRDANLGGAEVSGEAAAAGAALAGSAGAACEVVATGRAGNKTSAAVATRRTESLRGDGSGASRRRTRPRRTGTGSRATRRACAASPGTGA